MIRFLLLIALAALAAMFTSYRGMQEVYDILKPLTTILIIAMAVVGGWQHRYAYTYWLWAGLLTCLIGDVLLLRESGFVFGLGSFLLAHICFSIAIVSRFGWPVQGWVALVLMLIGVGYYRFLQPHLGAMGLPVLVYVLAILTMVYLAVSSYLRADTDRDVLRIWAVSSILFAVSDSLIAYNKFVSPLPLAGILILSTYWLE